MSVSSSVRTRFLIISDTHNFEIERESTAFPLNQRFPHADVLLHCGDLTHCGGASSYKKALKLLGSFDAELKLVIAGNHDLDLDKDYWKTHLEEDDEEEDHSRAVDVMTGPLAAQPGVQFLPEGTHMFTLSNGATFTLYASPYTTAFCDWAFAYERGEDRFNVAQQVSTSTVSAAENPIPDGVDIVMTHGPPKGIFDACPQGSVGCEKLLQAVRRVKPLMHCFGHIHEAHGARVMDWGTECLGVEERHGADVVMSEVSRGRESLVVNAAIMDAKNRPMNAPWSVELQLQKT